ncbi:phosphoethanolamine transferase [Orbus wheelerorum]
MSFVLLLLFLMNNCLLFYKFIVFFLMVIAILHAPVGLLYNFPDVNSIGSLMYTNKDESLEFFFNIPSWVYIYQFLLFVVGVLILNRRIYINKKLSYLFLILFLIIAFTSTIKNSIKNNYDYQSLLHIRQPEIRFFIDIYESFMIVKNQNYEYLNIINTQDNWHPTIINDDYDTYILVIGESVRKDFMEHWGFPIKNTPWMSKQPGTYLNNYISAGPSTVISLTNSLVLNENNKSNLINNIITLSKSAKMDSWWISNQGSKGAFDSPVAIIGKMSDHYTFIKDGNSNDKQFIPDSLLIPYIEDALASDYSKKKFIVVHIFGSHPKPCARTNNQYEKLISESTEISCYVESIKHTDEFLKNITVLASKYDKKWTMVYFSDHGLKLVNKGYKSQTLTHGYDSKQSYDVPFFMTSYNANKIININAKRSGLYLLSILSQWMGINDDLLNNNFDWFSDKEYSDNIDVYDSAVKKISYDSLKDDTFEYYELN